MKIAKKLLAAVVAVMIVCSLAVCAFAATPESAETGYVTLETDWTLDSSDRVTVKLYFVDAVDLKSWDLLIDYDNTIFAAPAKSQGSDTKQVGNCLSNSVTWEFNEALDATTAKFSGFFKEVLWTSQQFLDDSDPDSDDQCIVNSDKFHALTMRFTVIDKEKFNSQTTSIKIVENKVVAGESKDSTMTFEAAKAVSAEVTHVVEVVTEPQVTEPQVTEPQVTEPQVTEPQVTEPQVTEPQVTEPQVTEPQVTEPQVTEPQATRPVEDDDDCRPGKPGHTNCKPGKPACKPGKPNHNHPNTGDSAALAAAAGVVLLAGAAFVVSKKRK